MQNRGRLSLEDPLPLSEVYRQRRIKLAPKLITDWQRVGVALDMLIRAEEIKPGKFSSCKAIHTLLVHLTTTFDKTPEVYQKSIVQDVLDAIAPADSRSRRRHNAIIENLAKTRLKGRDILPSPAALDRDAAAREELGKLAARLPDGLPDNLPAGPPALRRRVEGQQLNPEMVDAFVARFMAEAGETDTDGTPACEVDPVEPDAGVENLADMPDEDSVEPDPGVENLVDMSDEELMEPCPGVENLEATLGDDLVEPDADAENLGDTPDVERTTEEKLADILAAGRIPDPGRESDEYILFLKRLPVVSTAPSPGPVGLLHGLAAFTGIVRIDGSVSFCMKVLDRTLTLASRFRRPRERPD